MLASDQAGVRLWRCPACDRPLEHARFAPIGCMGVVTAVGECPMHRTILVRGSWDALRAELAGVAAA